MKCDIVNHMAEAWHSGKTVGRGKKGTRERPWEGEYMRKFRLNLRLFEGEGEGSSAQGNGVAAAPAAQAADGTGQEGQGARGPGPGAEGSEGTEGTGAQEPTPEERQAEYKRMKGEYKDLFDQDVQNLIKRRYTQNQDLQRQLNAYAPLMDMLSVKYGIESGKVEDIISAINQDASFYEDAAMREGMTAEQYKRMVDLELKYRQAQETARQAQQIRQREDTYARWDREAEACKGIYPNFDMAVELGNENFVRLLGAGWDVKGAYEACHLEEIKSGIAQQAAADTKQKVAANIRAGAGRPSENGAAASAPSTSKIDVSKMTYAQMDEMIERSKRGERIEF